MIQDWYEMETAGGRCEVLRAGREERPDLGELIKCLTWALAKHWLDE